MLPDHHRDALVLVAAADLICPSDRSR